VRNCPSDVLGVGSAMESKDFSIAKPACSVASLLRRGGLEGLTGLRALRAYSSGFFRRSCKLVVISFMERLCKARPTSRLGVEVEGSAVGMIEKMFPGGKLGDPGVKDALLYRRVQLV
jgi:hypothetical protein